MAKKPKPEQRYASGMWEGHRFEIAVSETETLRSLKKHFRETAGHDKITDVQWFYKPYEGKAA